MVLLFSQLLYDRFPSWAALVNIAGSEFPLKNNLAFVNKYLESKKSIERGVTLERKFVTAKMYNHRFKYYWHRTKLRRTKRRRPPAPYNLTLYKGQRSGVLARDWVWFLLYHPVSRGGCQWRRRGHVTLVHPIPEFLAWCRDSGHTEEHFAHTLTMITNITAAGAELRVTQRRSFVSRPVVAATWRYRENATCAGRWRHSVCVYGAADIPRLLNLSRAEDGPIMANKFQSEVRCRYLDYIHIYNIFSLNMVKYCRCQVDPAVVPCLDQMLHP